MSRRVRLLWAPLVGLLVAAFVIPSAVLSWTGRERARVRLACHHLGLIAVALMVYQNDYIGHCPPDLRTLCLHVFGTSTELVSPLDDDPQKGPDGMLCSYEYAFEKYPRLLGGRALHSMEYASRQILVWDRKAFCDGRRCVLFADMHVGVGDEAAFKDMISELDEREKQLADQAKKREQKPDKPQPH